jgi:hypothetical protein
LDGCFGGVNVGKKVELWVADWQTKSGKVLCLFSFVFFFVFFFPQP